ncbi:MAG: pyrroline-5-carboxylate reductase [Pseudomonadota bacterium]
MSASPFHVLLVGCGKMGSALLAGWIERGFPPEDIAAVEPDAINAEAARRLGVAVANDIGRIPQGFAPEMVVIALKPQAMDAGVPAYRPFAEQGAAFLSIAAGRPIAYFERLLGPRASVLRAMPNTPAAVHRGITVGTANARADARARARAETLLAAVGTVEWVEDESLIDAVTAVSGSGPAYVFLLAECLAEAGRAAGLPEALSARLARATVSGSGELLHRSNESPATLRKNVTSPGGTTAAALGVLMADDGLKSLLVRAVAAATRRARELAG